MTIESGITRTSEHPSKAEKRAGFEEIDILWISEGMSCDGDTVSMTASGQPAIEDLVLGLVPGLPKVNLHNKVLSPTTGGEEFLAPFRAAARGEAERPFILVIEGSIPNQNIIEGDGYWTSFGNDEETGEPLTLNWWLDRLAHRAWAVVAAGTCATYGGIHAMAGNPTGAMGLADYLGWDFRSQGALPIVNVPGCPIQPENFMETLVWVLHHAAGAAPPPPLDHMLRPQWLFGKTVHEGCDRGRLLRAGRLRQGLQLAQVPGEGGLLGPGGQLQRAQARLDVGGGRLPQRGRHLHRMHDARLPRRVHAVHGRADRRQPLLHPDPPLRRVHPADARHHQHRGEPGGEVAPQPARTDQRLRPALAPLTLQTAPDTHRDRQDKD